MFIEYSEQFYMAYERSKNAIRNIKFGAIEKAVSILLPFVVRTIFIRTLGAEYSGLNSLFASILTVLNLTELGFNTAITYNLYKPIANDDTLTINALLYYYRKVYRYVGLIILVLGLLVVPFLSHFIKDSYPADINLTLVYLVFLLDTVLSYFLFAYYRSLLFAFQRNDVLNRINVLVAVVHRSLQILILLTVRNYYVFILTMPVFTLLGNFATATVAKRMLPKYHPEGQISKELHANIREKVSGLVVTSVCVVSRNAFDSIFVSMFLGLVDTTMYNNYYYIMNSIIAVMIVPASSIMAGLGNSVAVETPEKNYRDMNRLNFAYMWVSGWFTVCLLCLYQPFMKIWMGEALMFPFSVVVLFCLYFYVLKMGDIRGLYVEATGIWWEQRFRSIAEAVANLVLNYLLGKYYGVYGIIAATLISLFLINFCYGSTIIFRHYFKGQRIREYFGSNALYATVTAVIAVVTLWLCSLVHLGDFAVLVVRMLICTLVPNALYYLFYRHTKQYRESVPWIMERLKMKRRASS